MVQHWKHISRRKSSRGCIFIQQYYFSTNLKKYLRIDITEKAIVQFTQCPESSSSNELSLNLDSTEERKGVITCTKHSISNYVSYTVLYTSFVSIPHYSIEALKDLNWMGVMMEEMKVLTKHETWELVPPPLERNLLAAN